MAVRRGHVRYFADENALGLAKILLRGRDDIVHPGHPLLPEVPRGTPDLTWLRVVGRLDLIVLTRERRIRTRPVELFTRLEPRLNRLAVKLGPGPWAVAMRPTGVWELRLRDPAGQ